MTALWIPTPAKWLASFATAGKGVLTDAGKRGLLSNGKRALFNSSGACSECCGGCVPCPNNLTPAYEYQLTLNGFDATICTACYPCDCGPNPTRFAENKTLNLDGVYTIPHLSTIPTAGGPREIFAHSEPAVGTRLISSGAGTTDCTDGSFIGTYDIDATIEVHCQPDRTIRVFIAFDGIDACVLCDQVLFDRDGLACLAPGESRTGVTDPNMACGVSGGVLYFTSGGTVGIELVEA